MKIFYRRFKIFKNSIGGVSLHSTALKSYVSSSGQIISSTKTGVSTKFQRQISRLVKRSRYISLLPYCDRHFK